ncbi:NAD(P)/FAD-dependent oxidoreductase [Halalkalicoccus jeotgali]|uniref:Nadh dehydrogenase n=1 Tax=Halalkalicoccus jeotgali (strain DSM 18796 / CECT 7217 / JCM 14584 / KCTC 4019 / B3) TaxID=795797 RepID=D8J4Z8_HALJB|nr:FAD-dependent oxidoreductase [Halalkalicoccus jeotgali]ADJ15615.1 nadh dehydrogenase [Halalkalicoccus jeotgali B3]ELY36307.1 nadh dehydrogenase [Halalkalicoccus jeotgali B3]
MRIVVCGAGYAGVTLAKRLERALSDAEIVLVDRDPYHLIQHELHRVIRRPDLAEVIRLPLDSLFERVTVREDVVEAVDRAERVIRCADGEIAYDYAAVCLGAETNYYDLPGVEEHSIPLKRLEDAHRIRERVVDGSRVVVGGAGLSGVQVAGELAALDSGPLITLLERFEAVAPNFPANFQAAVREELETRGVEVRTGATVKRASERAVETDDGEIPYDTFVWTGGIRGPSALGGERPAVRSDLRLDSRTFAVGDAARVVDDDGEAVPASAQAAIREARVVAKHLAALAGGNADGFAPRPERFAFDSPGWLVSVGDGAVAQVGPTVLQGRSALALKASVGAGYLSSIGAVRNAVDLLNEELGASD